MHITNVLPKMVFLGSLFLSQLALAQQEQQHTAHQSMAKLESQPTEMDHSKMEHMDHSNMSQMDMAKHSQVASAKTESSKKESCDTKKQARTGQQGDQHAQH